MPNEDETPDFEDGEPIATIELHTEREMVMTMVALSLFQAKTDSMAPLDPQAAYDTAVLFNVQHRAYSADPETWSEATEAESDAAYYNGGEMSSAAAIAAVLEENRVAPEEYVARFHAERGVGGEFDGTDIDIE